METYEIEGTIRAFYHYLLQEAQKGTGAEIDSTVRLLTYGTVSAFVSKAMNELANEVMGGGKQAE